MTPSLLSARPGRRHRGWSPRRHRHGLAIDLGSARTRAWASGRGIILDVPTVTFPGTGAIYPVQRGAVVDPEGTARMLERLLGRYLPRFGRPRVVLTTPVLGGPHNRAAALTALEALRPSSILTVPGARAVVLAEHGEVSRPVVVVDLGAHLTEVALLIDGAVTDAYRTALGTADLDGSTTVGDVARAVADMVADMLRYDDTGHAVDALRHGVLLAGGGALRPECSLRIAELLGTGVRPVAAPQTAALRGAARLLESSPDQPPVAEP